MGRTVAELQQMQSLPLSAKISMSEQRIREWYEYHNGMVFVSFSGGKDSTVLLHLVRSIYPDVPAVFCDTGLEYPEIKQFVKTIPNVTIIRPNLTFRQVIEKYGYPVVSKDVASKVYYARKGSDWAKKHLSGLDSEGVESKWNERYKKWEPLVDAPFDIGHKCCHIMKEYPMMHFQSVSKMVPFIGTLASESTLRQNAWVRTGCSVYEGRRPHSAPLSFWTEQDILQYLVENNIEIASVYGKIKEWKIGDKKTIYSTTKVDRTGCMFCMFGAHLDKQPTRFQRMKISNPKLYDYCINGGTEDENGKWVPDDKGLGVGRILDYLNIKH